MHPLPPAMCVKVLLTGEPLADHRLGAAMTVDVAAGTVDPVRSGVAG